MRWNWSSRWKVNIDYILMLVEKYRKDNCKDKEILVAIDKAIRSSLQLRSKKELIERFPGDYQCQYQCQRRLAEVCPPAAAER